MILSLLTTNGDWFNVAKNCLLYSSSISRLVINPSCFPKLFNVMLLPFSFKVDMSSDTPNSHILSTLIQDFGNVYDVNQFPIFIVPKNKPRLKIMPFSSVTYTFLGISFTCPSLSSTYVYVVFFTTSSPYPQCIPVMEELSFFSNSCTFLISSLTFPVAPDASYEPIGLYEPIGGMFADVIG